MNHADPAYQIIALAYCAIGFVLLTEAVMLYRKGVSATLYDMARWLRKSAQTPRRTGVALGFNIVGAMAFFVVCAFDHGIGSIPDIEAVISSTGVLILYTEWLPGLIRRVRALWR